MRRYVEVLRWRDLFWNELHPYPKILLCFLYDTADNAGFVDYSSALWLTQLKGKTDNRYSEFTKKDLLNSLEDLKDKLISNGKNKLFIKDFLKHQRKLPLIKGNEESDLIIEKLQSNLKKFNDAPEILELLNSVKVKVEEEKASSVKKNKTQPTKFIPPSYEDFEAYYLSQSPDTGTENIKELFDHYVSCGWKVGNKPMQDFEAAIRNAIRRAEKNEISKSKQEYISKSFGKEKKQSRTEITFSVADEMKKETK